MSGVGPLLAILLGVASASSTDAGIAPSAPATMQWQVRDLPVLRRVAPAWPAGVVEDAGEVACRASVRVGGDGVPAEITVHGCPAPFAFETERALGDWRWAAWGSVVERRVSLTVRFPRPTPVVAPHPAAEVAHTPSDRPVIPSYADALAHGVPERDAAEDGIVCSASITRNRAGSGVRSKVGACPARFREAAERAVEELRREPARRATPKEPRKRVQDVQITFRVTTV